MDALITVSLKVAVMIIMIAVGWFLSKKGAITEKGTGEITWLLLNIVSVKAGEISNWSLVLSALLAGASLSIGILLSFCMFRKQPKERQTVLRFGVIFSNAGFMGMPLIEGVLGDDGVIFGSFFIAVFNLFCWTYGYYMMSGGEKVPLRKIFLNPGTIGLAIGLPLYLFGIHLPELLLSPIVSFSDLNTPLAMLVVGSYIAKVPFKEFLTDKHIYAAAAGRLLILPILVIGLL
ncbi:MAG: AEC family transporter, partial [Oscillospiraceae bacterium]